ncbi:M23 family metallopeptidase [Modestobacter sp. VKM Ac-2986]|uniref:M23 family metallopeptidase n=1 Tax=Modestobacter sp. VKM Ac-2986 TaxID=3004140 RepID=UPI0022ABB3A8|nr:M23 family metallopeptidase [Modestobacter sp. VKM Ac-2986]MCZ2830514.1 M23 family metallopeptidase [Modestobacter sp. VKM Ac-2986]
MGSRIAGTTIRSSEVEPPTTGTTDRPARTPRAQVTRRRPAALLAALVVGGLTAALLGTQGAPRAVAEEPIPVAMLLGSDAEGIFDVEMNPHDAITEVEARARLEEVAANRAERAKRAADEQAAAEARAAAEAEAARPKAVSPVADARLSSCFCPRWGTMHWGIDLAAPMMTPEYSAEDGVVLRAGAASGYGQAVYILGVSGDVTVYGHMEKILVSAGDVVDAGDKIALLGSRGQSTGPHLHFEVHKGGMGGKRVDPVQWLAARGVEL